MVQFCKLHIQISRIIQIVSYKLFLVRLPRAPNFPDIIKSSNMFMKTTFKDSIAEFQWKMPLMSAELKRSYVIYIFFESSLGKVVRYSSAKSHHCRICVTNFREEGRGFLPSPNPWAAPKRIGLINVTRFDPSVCTAWSADQLYCILSTFVSTQDYTPGVGMYISIILVHHLTNYARN